MKKLLSFITTIFALLFTMGAGIAGYHQVALATEPAMKKVGEPAMVIVESASEETEEEGEEEESEILLEEAEIELIAQTVEAEAGNQSYIGKRLVVATVLNRVNHEAFPDTIEEVISQPGQFSTYPELKDIEATEDDYEAVYEELQQTCNSSVLFFRTGRYGYGVPLMKYEDHYFSTLED